MTTGHSLEINTKYVSINGKVKMVLYVHLLNDLFGIMKATLLYYKIFVKGLKSIAFVLNNYEPCVTNKIVQNKTTNCCLACV